MCVCVKFWNVYFRGYKGTVTLRLPDSKIMKVYKPVLRILFPVKRPPVVEQ